MAAETETAAVPQLVLNAGQAYAKGDVIIDPEFAGVVLAEGQTAELQRVILQLPEGETPLEYHQVYQHWEGLYYQTTVWGCPTRAGAVYDIDVRFVVKDADGNYVRTALQRMTLLAGGNHVACAADQVHHHGHPHGHDWGLHTHPEPSSIGGNQAAIAALERRVAALEAAAVSGSGSGREGA